MNEHEIAEQAYRNGYEARVKACKAEIERLQEENKKLKAIIEAIDDTINPLPFVTDFDIAIKTAKSEAIKEFAEKIKGCCYQLYEEKNGHEAGKVVVLEFAGIDYLVKELTEGKE